MKYRDDEYTWEQKYRPRTIEECILPKHIKDKAQGIINSGRIPNLILAHPSPGIGKAQPLTSKILTKDGWKTFADITLTDKVITPDGNIVDIIGIYDQPIGDIYETEFYDGRIVESNKDHLWKVRLKDKKDFSILSTLEIKTFLDSNKSDKRVYVPKISKLDTDDNDIELPLDPYILGYLLGNGGLTSGSVRFSTKDDEVLKTISSRLIDNYTINKIGNTKFDYNIVRIDKTNSTRPEKGVFINKYKYILDQIGVYDHLSTEKDIPEIYFNSSRKQKEELIAGLVDSDGYVSKYGCVQYTSSSLKLITSVQTILFSLGGQVKLSSKIPTYSYKGKKLKGKLSYTLTIRYRDPKKLSLLSRKLDRINANYQYKDSLLRIKEIRSKRRDVSRCIKIDSPDELYITDNYIVTHNTTFAMVLCRTMNVDVMAINASLHANMDALRNSVAQFASKASFDQQQKVIFWDEADGIARNTQEALRGFIETFSANCSHIFTANYEHKIIPHIKGRCDRIDFDIPAQEKPKLAKQLIKRLKFILDTEGVEYSEDVLVELVLKKFPNYRSILITLQTYSNIEGKIDTGILSSLAETSYKELIIFLKNKEFNKMRKWVADNCSGDPSGLFSEFYDYASDYLADESIPDMILTLAKYQANVPMVANQEINTASCLTELMMLEGWK